MMKAIEKIISELGGLQGWRNQQLQEFYQRGLPQRQDEHWKYTDLSALLKKNFVIQPSESSIQNPDFSRCFLSDCFRLVFINGHFSPGHSNLDGLPDSIILQENLGLENGLIKPEELSTFYWLNGALLNTGMILTIPSQVELTKPIHLIYYTADKDFEIMQHPRHIIQIGAQARAVLLEEYRGDGQSYFNNVVTKISLAEGAHLNYYKLQRENRLSFHIANTSIEQSADSQLQAFHIALGSQINREDFNIKLQGKGAQCELAGFYYPQTGQHIDFHTRIDHECPHTISRQFYKGMIDGSGRGVFNGKIIIHPQARHAQALQKNDNLLLSDMAEMNTKPELEVLTDEVSCVHGATVGQLDAESLFYLRSRGIDEGTARSLLKKGFIDDVLNRIPDPVMADYINQETEFTMGAPDYA